MATQSIDHRNLKSWEDAFASAPVPAVRQLERQIRNDISTNRERLRSLVGGSYRDLLATAETIGQMDKRMRGLETVLSDELSRKCNTGLLERTRVRSKALMDQARAPEKTEPYALASQMAVFRACPGVILRIMRAGKASLLTAAKILVISRVLYTKKLKDKKRFAGTIQATFGRLGSIRAKLLAVVESRIASINLSTEFLLDAMSAYALATTSSAADILRHFHHVRATSIKRVLEPGPGGSAEPVRGLKTWLQTLRDTQAVFPRQLVNALNQLKSKPLLAGSDVLEIAALELDVHSDWLGEDVRGFVPYVRHDDLDMAAAKKQLSSWAPTTLKSYLGDLSTCLEAQDNLPAVARSRRECLAAWFSGSSRITGVPRGDVLLGLRNAFSNRLQALTELQSASLSSVSDRIRKVLTEWDTSETEPRAAGLWDTNMTDHEISNGGKRFTDALQESLQGRSPAGDEIVRMYHHWLQNFESIEKVIEEQRKLRWQDLSEDYDDDSDEEELRVQSLSKVDPDALQKKLTDSVASALDHFQTALQQASAENNADPTTRSKAAFLLRLIREFQTLLPRSYTKPFATEIKSGLHQHIAQPIAASVLRKYGPKITQSLQARKLAVRDLWSDSPALPIMPSPWAFRVLRTVQTSLVTAGQDLWTESAVVAVKGELAGRLADVCGEARQLTEKDGGEEGEDGKGAELAKDVYVQHLFDTCYLAAALKLVQSEKVAPHMLGEHAAWLVKSAGVSQGDEERIQNSAHEHWKRTSLLFALLA